MAKQIAYLCKGSNKERTVALVIVASDVRAEVAAAWSNAVSRATAMRTLDPGKYTDNDSVDAIAVEELRASHSDWQVIHANCYVTPTRLGASWGSV